MDVDVHFVDAFVVDRVPNSGNPAAVVVLDGPYPKAASMQALARQIGLSETAFVQRRGIGSGQTIRWFTPEVEVDLCGHATLAAAAVLDFDDVADLATNAAGTLRVFRRDGLLWLNFPLLPFEPFSEAPHSLLTALGLAGAEFCARSTYDTVVQVDTVDALVNMKPHFEALRTEVTRGVIVTARFPDSQTERAKYVPSLSEGVTIDFASRFFAPAAGIDEDPVTGSAHCVLAGFWSQRMNKDKLVAVQLSSRKGLVYLELAGDRVLIGGATDELEPKIMHIDC